MNKKFWHISGFLFCVISGIFLHFTYGWSGENRIAGIFSSVSESTWEHMKLIFWPFLVWSIIEFIAYGKKRADFFAVKTVAVFASLFFMVSFFYTYSGIVGYNLFEVDIATFVLSVAFGCLISYKLLQRTAGWTVYDSLRGGALLILTGICFYAWTFNPPDLGIFWG